MATERQKEVFAAMRAFIDGEPQSEFVGEPTGEDPLEVVVERSRVWIRRGSQSFMLAYDDPASLEWYAETLRKVLQCPKAS